MPVILIVDDQNTNRQIYAKLAQGLAEDVKVTPLADPILALDWLKDNTPDLVITDFKMPRMDGDEFIERIRSQEHLSEIPVIAITIFEEKELRLRALDAGATDFLLSPVDHREFSARARNLLRLHRQNQILADRARHLEQSLTQSERDLESSTRHAQAQLARVIDTIPVMVSATDLNGNFLFMNVCKAKYLGLDIETVIGQDSIKILGEPRGKRARKIDQLVIASKKPVRAYEEEILGVDGRKRVFQTTKSPLFEDNGEVIGVVTNAQDISDRKAAEDHLRHLAHHDSLTGLANRILLRDRLEREIGRCRRGDGRFAIHLVDLDGFKQVNDVNGHAVGDELLIRVGEQLSDVIGADDLAARLGGDEFAILQANVRSDAEIARMAEAIKDALPQAITSMKAASEVTGSVGIATHPDDGGDFEQLMRNADLAMYRSKAANGNNICFFASDIEEREKDDFQTDELLRNALSNHLFELYYQPQVDLQSGRIIGAEALLRIRTEQGKIITPGEFLPRAERNGMIMPINEWVLRSACQQGVAWRKEGLPDISIGVNLSPVQFQRQSVPLLVGRLLGESGFPAHLLDLELTESIVLHDTEAVAIQLAQLRQLGVKISIDDFGTGCSSLSYVKHFPVDRLKVDQSFVRDMHENPSDAAIVRATISLGHSLGMEVIAEGVEYEQVSEMLSLEQCDSAQGYLFGKPQPASVMANLLRQQMQEDVPMSKEGAA
ncbi:MAG TPA: diguanylate cyclase [Rhizobiales bacterium]|nr:diguanylate cyclase [Hyphomicrobiales bacterium]